MSTPSMLLDEVKAGLPIDLRDLYFGEDSGCGIHLAVMREPYLTLLLQGLKTIESRFSLNRVDPFDKVQPGDLVLLKAGAVVGAFVVGAVIHQALRGNEINALRHEFNDRIVAEPSFWELKREARFASLIGVEQVREFVPFTVSKRDMRGWVVLRASDRELLFAW